MFERTALPAGPRVISARVPGARSVSVAAYVLAGSRLETAEQVGAAHFMEHITFKGTAAYPTTRSISEAVEGAGGSFNAATDRESTVYWVRVPGREAARGVDVLGELIVRPTLDGEEIEGERTVIIEEIRSYLDDPSEYCQTLFQGALFGEGPLGREICGDEEGIRALPGTTIRDFWRVMYRPANTVVAIAGDLGHDEAVELVANAFGSGNGVVPGFAAAPELPAGPRVMLGKRDTTQAQLCIGVPALRRDHPDSWTLAVLNAILGDGMSSRLFIELRERRSLTYDVSTFGATYADCGTFGVHAGFDPDQAPALVAAILEQLERVVHEPVSAVELDRARAYTRGRLELRMEETGAVASWLGTGESLLPRILTVDEVIERLDAVTVEDMLRVARTYARPDLARLAVLGPFRSRLRFERMLNP